jgi:hypothetical protein
MGIALAIITTWSLFLVLFLIGWHRLCVRNEQYDRGTELDLARRQAATRMEDAVKRIESLRK